VGAEAGEGLPRLGEGVRVEAFDLASAEWLERTRGADLVVSSLVVHHLTSDGKRSLFRALQERLPKCGALLLADLVEPLRAEARTLFAGGWEQAVGEAAGGRADGEELRRRF